ncbi:MAG: GTP cyclohydrolase I FolE [Planctomycetota bacterium]|jgi:GTP cyclohydrolase I|nr:GTP cyclohydrolase I FolE [Planctomycetota bacterium]
MSHSDQLEIRREIVEKLLESIGEDPTREGLLRTPERVAKSFDELTQGSHQNLEDVVGKGVFNEDCSEMVIVKDIEFYSLCEHHMLPFYGRVHVAYIPDGRIIGLSKIPRIVDMFARRLQVQERMTSQIAEAIQEVLQPKGVGVVADAAHLCMMMRGVQKQNSSTMTSCLVGSFRSDPRTRSEFLDLVRNKLR